MQQKRRTTVVRGTSWLALGMALLPTSSAWAQDLEGFALNRLEPAERGSEWFVADGLDFRGDARPAMGLVLDWARRPLVFRGGDGTSTTLIESQLFAHFGSSMVLGERLRLGASLPVALQQAGESMTIDGRAFTAPRGSAAGDLRLSGDVRLLGEYRSEFSLAAGVRAWLPTGDRSSFTGDDALRLGGQVLAAGERGTFVYAARLGVNYRALEEPFANSSLGTEATFAVAGGVRLLEGALVVGPELFGSTVLVDGAAFSKEATPFEAIVGGHYTRGPWRFGAGFGPGLTRGMGSPSFRGLLSVEYIPVVEEPQPAAPVAPPVPECPAPVDTDGDGIVDGEDACPRLAGVSQDDPNQHGCPLPVDTDGDGIVDAEDACPNEAGQPNADAAQHGCPLPPDADGDGIVDAEDACPTEAGSPSDDPERHGCPQVKVSDSRIELLQRVEFALGKADLLPESHELLRDVVRVIKTLPETARIRVEGHTDNRGWQELNRTLSQQRAEAVVAWLVREGGIAAERLEAVGKGDAQPIASNETEQGRQTNRRVEFHIVEGSGGDAGEDR